MSFCLSTPFGQFHYFNELDVEFLVLIYPKCQDSNILLAGHVMIIHDQANDSCQLTAKLDFGVGALDASVLSVSVSRGG